MKKIAMIDYDMGNWGGVEKVLVNIATALLGEYEIHVLSLCLTGGSWQYEFPEGIRRHAFFHKTMRIRQILTHLGRPLKKYLKENGIDLLMYFGHYPAFCCGVLLGKKYRSIFCDHGAIMNQWDDREARIIRRTASKKAGMTIVLTDQSREAYEEKFPWTRGRIKTIYNWIDEKYITNAGEYDSGSHRLITAGRPDRQKGIDLLLETAKKLYEITDDFEWDIYGVDDDDIRAFADETEYDHEYMKNIHPAGFTSNMEKVYAGHGIYVMTSYVEGLPLVLLEAKANHLPIVSFDIISGPSDIIENDDDGYLIPAFDTGLMAEKIAYLLTNKSERIRLSAASAHRMDRFDKKNILNQWRELISGLI